MTNLKRLELEGDPDMVDAEDDLQYLPFPLHQFESIKGLEELKLVHSIDSKCVKAYAEMMHDLLPQMPNLTRFENEFAK